MSAQRDVATALDHEKELPVGTEYDLVWPQSRSEHLEEKKFLAVVVSEPQTDQPVT